MSHLKPSLHTAVLICAIFATAFAVGTGMDTSSRVHLGRMKKVHAVRTSAALNLDSPDLNQTVDSAFGWSVSKAQSTLSQVEKGLISVCNSVVSSAMRRHWLPQAAVQMLSVSADRSVATATLKPHASQPIAEQGAKKFAWMVSMIISVVLVIGIYSMGLFKLLKDFYQPTGNWKAYVAHTSKKPEASETTKNIEDGRESIWDSGSGNDCDMVEIGIRELSDDIGVSALCCLDANSSTCVTLLPNKRTLPLIAVQSVLLQGGLLYYMLLQLVPRDMSKHEDHPLPHSIVFIAIYLHFLNCYQELPFSVQVFRHMPDFHSNLKDLLLMGAVLMTDAFVVPSLAFVLGAIYICTSRTIGDVILNAVAVAFVVQIDNWVLIIANRTNFLSGHGQDEVLYLPQSKDVMRRIAWTVVYVPVLPAISALVMCWLSFSVMGV